MSEPIKEEKEVIMDFYLEEEENILPVKIEEVHDVNDFIIAVKKEADEHSNEEQEKNVSSRSSITGREGLARDTPCVNLRDLLLTGQYHQPLQDESLKSDAMILTAVNIWDTPCVKVPGFDVPYVATATPTGSPGKKGSARNAPRGPRVKMRGCDIPYVATAKTTGSPGRKRSARGTSHVKVRVPDPLLTPNSMGKLLADPFLHQTEEVKLEIKALGRPCPILNMQQIVAGGNGRNDVNRKFSADYYKKFDWLCACEFQQKLFCFPCVLYQGDKVWSREGYSDLNHLSYMAKKHELSSGHLENVISLAFLGKTDIRVPLSDALTRSIIEHNKKVDDNRYVLDIIINCIKFCGSSELAMHGHEQSQDSLNSGDFRGLINFSAELDPVFKVHLEKSTMFTETIQNDILQCMLTVCQDEIKNEISSAEHLAVIADETSDVSDSFQVAIVFRYIVKGQPVERFFEFLQPSGHDSECLASAIMSSLDKVNDSKEKLVAQTYNGASVSSDSSGKHTSVQKIIKEQYPRANFYHCFAHHLRHVLTKTMSIYTSVRVFFANLTGICDFFSLSPERTAVLDEEVKRRVPRAVTTQWNFSTSPVSTVFENKGEILQCLRQLRDESWNYATIQQATAFVEVLEDYSFNFWLKFLHPIMLHVDVLYSSLQKPDVDAVGAESQIESFEAKVNEIRIDDTEIPTEPPGKKMKEEGEEFGLSLRRQAKEVRDLIVMEVKQRFAFTGHLSAATLLNSDKFIAYSIEFPFKLSSEASQIYCLDDGRLKTELAVLYNLQEFRKVADAAEFLHILVENNLATTLRQIAKLCSLLATSPITSCEAESESSCLSKVKTFLRNSMGHDRLTALAMLSIEKSLVLRMRDFNAKVIEKFAAAKERRIELQYK